MIHIVLDLEATCDESNVDFQMEIIEIGAVAVDSRGEVLDTFEQFVKPIVNSQLTTFCKTLTTIKQSDVDTAPLFPTALTNFQRWIATQADPTYEDVRLWSWGYYDKNQFITDCLFHRRGIQWILDRHYNLRVAFKTRHNLPRNPSMDVALALKEMPLDGTHHRGIDDAKNLVKLFVDDMPWYLANTPTSK